MEQDQNKSVVLHHVSLENIYLLEETFAFRTADGWVIPDWLILMRQTATPKD